MLSTCEDHDCVVVYVGRDCPVCEEISEKDVQIENLESKVSSLEDEISDLQNAEDKDAGTN